VRRRDLEQSCSDWVRCSGGCDGVQPLRESTVDVALAAGFSDQPRFTRAFKAAFGVSPARYVRLAAAGA
jgi:AraC-like DNA-binding protein